MNLGMILRLAAFAALLTLVYVAEPWLDRWREHCAAERAGRAQYRLELVEAAYRAHVQRENATAWHRLLLAHGRREFN